MLRTYAFLILALIATVARADENLFQQGLAAFQGKKYTEARDAFAKILEEGNVTTEVLHNLALTEYQLNEKPRALALWRKALTLEPGHARARQGRDFVEAELGQRGFERDPLSLNLRRTLESLSIFETFWLLALTSAFAGWLWIRYWGARRSALEEERPMPPFPSAALGLSVIWVLSLALVALKAQSLSRVWATITVPNAQVRSLPSEDGVAVFDLKGGMEVRVRREASGWLQIQNPDGATGWVKESELLITSR